MTALKSVAEKMLFVREVMALVRIGDHWIKGWVRSGVANK